jgi:hypothetical protein
MTQAQAERAANVLLTMAAIGAAVYIIRTPRLRRRVWQLSVTGLTSQLPEWLGREVKHAWRETDPSGL